MPREVGGGRRAAGRSAWRGLVYGIMIVLLGVLPAHALPPPAKVAGEPVRFASASPFALVDALSGETAAVEAVGRLFLPMEREGPVPAVVLLHGAGGVMAARELTYARQFAAMGWAALVVDVFGSRVEPGTRFVERLLNVTEAMFLADAFAALDYLAAHPAIDGNRVALVGFSYGGMAATYAVHEQVARTFAPAGRRFAAHVAFYAPCIARFDAVMTTGAPFAMLYGTGDAIVDPRRCAEVVADVRSGGSPVLVEILEGAAHQWDARPRGIGRHAPRGLAQCDFTVRPDGSVWDNRTLLPMEGFVGRTAALAWCADRDGYRIEGDPDARRRSDAVLAAFLTEALALRGSRVDG
ncbi:MAG: dienelactone hydrolase family protein [Pseudomonadota bacterium]